MGAVNAAPTTVLERHPMFTDENTANILKIFGALTVMLTVTIPAFYLAVVKPIIAQLKDGQVKQQAAEVIKIEQNNRYNETRNATPVTNQSPPMSTGDGSRDAAVNDLLALTPTASSANAPLTAADIGRIISDEFDRRDAAKNAVPVAVVSNEAPPAQPVTP